MTGLEQMAISMLQKMTGLSPDEMTALANNAVNLIKSCDARLASMESQLAEIKAYLMPNYDEKVIPQIEAAKHD